MASVRERSPGRWEARVYVGLDPVSGKRRYETKTVSANTRDRALRAAQFHMSMVTTVASVVSMKRNYVLRQASGVTSSVKVSPFWFR